MKKMTLLISLVLAGCLLVVSTTAATCAPVTIAYNIKNLTNPFFLGILDGLKTQTAARGWELVTPVCNGDPTTQLQQCEDLINGRVNLLSFTPCDVDGAGVIVDEAYKAKIPVITVDDWARSAHVALTIISDNIKGGRLQGEYVAKKLKGSGNVVILEGDPGSQVSRDRLQGEKQGLSTGKNIRIVASQPAGWIAEQGLTVTENILQANPKIDAIIAQNDGMAMGAISAVKAAGRQGEIMIVGYDGIPDALKAIQQGTMAATLRVDGKKLGSLVVEYAEKILSGRKFEYSLSQKPWGKVPTVWMDLDVVSSENIDKFIE